jgi:hypothetical protein
MANHSAEGASEAAAAALFPLHGSFKKLRGIKDCDFLATVTQNSGDSLTCL